VLFDVNETTLDLSSLQEPFREAFGTDAALTEWFARLLQASHVCAMTGVRVGFRDLAAAGLERSAAVFDRSLSQEAKDGLLGGFARLSAHADVIPALERLRAAGRSTVAFSNSSRSLLETQIAQAGLTEHFDRLISVEEVGSFKPDARVYRYAANTLDRPPDRLWLVAAHDWDVHGAVSAGLRGAYVARGRAPYHPAYRPPTVQGCTLHEVIPALLDADDEEGRSTSEPFPA
jgi:2-haloacid dehalogenase